MHRQSVTLQIDRRQAASPASAITLWIAYELALPHSRPSRTVYAAKTCVYMTEYSVLMHARRTSINMAIEMDADTVKASQSDPSVHS
jgi:hypothetical protein